MDRQRERILNIPNILTMVRMALIGVFIWLFAAGHRYWALAVYVLANATDVLDGYIARKHGLVTSFGKLMDPLADKLMLAAALCCLMAVGLVPVWVVVVVLTKEVLMIVGASVLLKRGTVVHARFIGKAATVVFLLAVTATFLHEFVAPVDMYLQVLAVALSVAAMLWYFGQVLMRRAG